jgi:hypothetical protein
MEMLLSPLLPEVKRRAPSRKGGLNSINKKHYVLCPCAVPMGTATPPLRTGKATPSLLSSSTLTRHIVVVRNLKVTVLNGGIRRRTYMHHERWEKMK